MTTDRHEDVLEEAIRWHVRLADGSETDWAAFTAWLEADPAHGRAYEKVEDADEDFGEAFAEVCPTQADISEPDPALAAENDNAPARSRRWWIERNAIAASIAIAIFVGLGIMQTGNSYTVATAPGQTRTVTLETGDRIELNGATELTLDHDLPRFAVIEQGEATFTVQHDPDAPFIVQIGENRVEDLGTVFNIARGPTGIRVAVAEGTVVYNPDRQAVKLTAGQSLRDAADATELVVRPVEPGAVGSWRTGRLSYVAAPMAEVASDLSRAIGKDVILAPELSDRPFSGTITVDANRQQMFGDLADLLDLQVSQDERGWILADPVRAAR